MKEPPVAVAVVVKGLAATEYGVGGVDALRTFRDHARERLRSWLWRN